MVCYNDYAFNNSLNIQSAARDLARRPAGNLSVNDKVLHLARQCGKDMNTPRILSVHYKAERIFLLLKHGGN